MPRLRIVSYNIHKGRSASGSRESLEGLKLGLHGLRPDLVFMQEVQGRNDTRSSLDAQHEVLGAALDFNVVYGCNAVRDQTDHGNALLSRYPIVGHENQDISDHRLEQRGLLHVRVNVDGCEVHCFVVHLGLFRGSRSRQAMVLGERLAKVVPEHAPVIIAGDFNDWGNHLTPIFVNRLGLTEVFSNAPRASGNTLPRLRDSVRRLGEALRGLQAATPFQERRNQLPMSGNLQLAVPPRTFPSMFPWFRLDRIYQRGFAVRSARVMHGPRWARLSDHAPLVAELELA